MTIITIYDELESGMAELEECCDFLPDMSTNEGYQKSKRLYLDNRGLYARIDQAHKEAKADILEQGRKLDKGKKDLKGRIEALIGPHKEAYQAIDDLEKKREAKRKQELQDRVDFIVNLPEAMRDSHSTEVMAAMQDLQANECLDFYELANDALNARKRSLDQLGGLFADKQKAEKEAAELQALRKEKEERIAREHDERIAREAEEKAKAEAESKAQQERDAAEARERLLKEDVERAEREKQEAIERTEKERQDAIEAERKRVEDERVAAEKAEQDRLAKVAEDKAEAKRLAELAPDNEKLQVFAATVIADAINAIPNVSAPEAVELAEKIKHSLEKLQGNIHSYTKKTG